MPWTKYLFENQSPESLPHGHGIRPLSYAQAILEAQAQALERDPGVFLIGEGIDDPAGVFGTTQGLAERFGPDRVMDCPIAENGVTGIVAGAAVAGMRPVLIHMRSDFLLMAMDQLVNHAAKWRYMSGGGVNVPLVVRSVIGRGWGSAAQHSQGLHGLFLQTPGLKVVAPSVPHDAKGLLLAAIEDPDPVLVVEHRWLYSLTGHVPEEPYAVPLGKALVCRHGTDATVVGVSHMAYLGHRAALRLAGEGISAEVVDLRSICPLDRETILESVARTGRLVVADVACPRGGVAAEIACLVAENIPDLLKAPVVRVTFPEAPVPCSPALEAAYYPGEDDIVAAVKKTLRGTSPHE